MPQEKITLNADKWIDNYADYLFNYAVVRVNNSDLAKDLVQETFFAGLKSAKNFQGRSTAPSISNSEPPHRATPPITK